MKDCFVLRFNLENMVNPDTLDRTGALAAIFGIDKADLQESVGYYEERLQQLADTVNKDKVQAAREKFAGKKIAFFGDSLTSDRLSYANIIKSLNIFEKVDIYAVSGSVSSQMIRSFAQKVKSDSYDFVSMFIGTNDSALTDVDLPFVSPEEYRRNLSYAAKCIKEMGKQGICFKLPYHKERTFTNGQVITQEYNDVIEHIAQCSKFDVIELNNNELRYIDDNVHFVDITQRDIAEYFINHLITKGETLCYDHL